MKTVMKNQHSHFYLYAKGWYKKTDIVEDYRKLVANYSGIDTEYVSDGNIISILLNIVYPLIGKNEHNFKDFIWSLSPDLRHWSTLYHPGDEEYSFIKALILTCNSIFSTTKVKDDVGTILLELDAPDESVLPLPPSFDDVKFKKSFAIEKR